jgi:hypothetical protein
MDSSRERRLRKQATDWLRDDLIFWTNQAERQNAVDRAKAVKALMHWQVNSDLAGVRDEVLLAELPETERAAWTQLWSDVSALLKRLSEMK